MNNFSQMLRHCNHNILITSILLPITGILTIFSITSFKPTFLSREVIIQSAAFLLGLVCAAIMLMLGCRFFNCREKFLYAFAILMLLSVYVPGLGLSLNGSRSWVQLFEITFQPSEIVKIPYILLLALHLSASPKKNNPFPIIKAALYSMPFIILVSIEDFGTGCVYTVIFLFMIFCSALEIKPMLRILLALITLLPIFYYLLASYQKERIDAFLNPNNMELMGNYQVWNSKVAIGSGGFTGKGIVSAVQSRLGFLPVAESDFIFSSAVEAFGFIFGIIIIMLLSVLIYNALKTARYAHDLNDALAAFGITGMFFFQSFENIAMTMGIMPVTGIPLPFVSSGGSSMIASMSAAGLLLNISCHLRL